MLAVVFLATSCQKSPIPLRKMQRIWADMLIADANVNENPDLHLAADTLAIYTAIFEKYGYTDEQFKETQRYLLAHPKKFMKMAEKQKADFDRILAVAQREMAVRDSLADIEYQKELAIQVALDNFLDSISFACLLDTVFVDLGQDSVAVTVYNDDSTRFVAPFVRDTTVVADTLVVKHTRRALRDTSSQRRSIFGFFKKNRQKADTLTVEEPEE